MKISIIIPIYNMEDYLVQCLDSVIQQSYLNKEILLVNDGSTDTSEEICLKYEQKYPFVRLINKKNGGLSDARNVGILESKGDYLLFLDSDDYYEFDFLDHLIELIELNYDLDYILFRYKKYYQNAGRYEEVFQAQNLQLLKGNSGIEYLDTILKGNRNFNWFVGQGMVRRSFIMDNQLFFQVNKNYEDVLWTPQVLLKARHVEYYNQSIYIYRLEREGQITSDFSLKNLTACIYVSDFWYKELQKYMIERELKIMLMKNLMTQYFVAIWSGGFLIEDEKRELILLLRSHRKLLNSSNSFVSNFTSLLCKTFGFTVSLEIFKRSVIIKRFIRNTWQSSKNGVAESEVIN